MYWMLAETSQPAIIFLLIEVPKFSLGETPYSIFFMHFHPALDDPAHISQYTPNLLEALIYLGVEGN